MGLLQRKFYADETLPYFYRVLAINKDRKGKLAISAMEGANIPIYAVQFHPERNQFEWDTEESASKLHSPDGVTAMQYLSEFFVNEARRNTHRFSALQDEEKALIYNYPVTPAKNLSTDYYLQIYWFASEGSL